MDDPFAVLGLDKRFDLDPAAVQRAFAARSANAHASIEDGDEREPVLAGINRAKAAVENPESRADALLLLYGGPTRESERSLPEGFLREMMDIRQAMEDEMGVAPGSGQDSARVKWEGWAESRRAGHEARVAAMFRDLSTSGDAASGEALRAIRRELNAWRYIERMIEQIDSSRQGGM